MTRSRTTFTANSKRQIQFDNFSTAANLIASYTVCFVTHFVGGGIIGSLSNDGGDGNENVKTAVGYKFGRASRFLYIFFFAVTARLRRENDKFHVL